MKLLFVSEINCYVRSVYTLVKYVQVGQALGHEVAIFGKNNSEFPQIPFSLKMQKFDFTIFVIHGAWDFPEMPYLAQLLNSVPKERRIIIDCWGRYNETIRVDHDFNHLEKLDGHQGWEWIEAFQSLSDKILQPTMTPLRHDVRPFLFHAYDPAAVVRPYASAPEALQSWSGKNHRDKEYGLIYVGNNWQRWTQMAPFLQALTPLKDDLAPMCFCGWDWDKPPDWAEELGLSSAVDVDPALLRRLGVKTRKPIPFDQVSQLVGQGRFSPIFHRPLFNHLNLVTNRTFETFCADIMPILMLPDELVEKIYGSAAKLLVPSKNVAEHLEEIMRHPEDYWEAVLNTRSYLGRYHSYQQRFQELLAILES